jgi:hypothetical protein
MGESSVDSAVAGLGTAPVTVDGGCGIGAGGGTGGIVCTEGGAAGGVAGIGVVQAAKAITNWSDARNRTEKQGQGRLTFIGES